MQFWGVEVWDEALVSNLRSHVTKNLPVVSGKEMQT